MNIVLASVGRRVELVRLFRAAYHRLGLSGTIIGTDSDRLAPGMQEVDEAVLMPKYGDREYIPQLLRLCEEHSVQCLFPLNDGQLQILADNRSALARRGTVLSGLPSAATATCGDKWLTDRFFRQLGLPTARAWLPSSDDDVAEFEFPLFMKPRDGSAGESAFKIDSPEQYRFFASYVRNPIVQSYLPGPEITADVVCNFDGVVHAVICRERIAVRGGEAIKSVTIRDARIEQACVEIAEAFEARGPFTVQCMMMVGVPHFVEINARMGGGLPLAVAAGVDVPAILLSALAGLPLETMCLEPTAGVYMTRFDESFFLGGASHATVERRYLRSR